ncbi:unnamed protein product [Protopolystoma xenopodis]|uniref:Uncharacterized protein n=1 Tax=Protopolystoma xenopodis TaxID=117903 RepID=A0A448WCX8_9PLAT|nr:unnamed protein product [Protopolystoma xenopodis]
MPWQQAQPDFRSHVPHSMTFSEKQMVEEVFWRANSSSLRLNLKPDIFDMNEIPQSRQFLNAALLSLAHSKKLPPDLSAAALPHKEDDHKRWKSNFHCWYPMSVVLVHPNLDLLDVEMVLGLFLDTVRVFSLCLRKQSRANSPKATKAGFISRKGCKDAGKNLVDLRNDHLRGSFLCTASALDVQCFGGLCKTREVRLELTP